MLRNTRSAIERLWSQWIRPAPTVTDPDERRRARVLAGLILLSLPIQIVDFLIGTASVAHPLSLLPPILIMLVAYALSRRGHYHAGGALMILTLLFNGLFVAYVHPTMPLDETLFTLDLIFIAVIAAHYVFSLRAAVIVSAAAFAGALINVLLMPAVLRNTLLHAADLLVLLLSITAMFALMQAQFRHERLQAEHALRESEKRYRTMVDFQTELVARWTPDTRFTYVNEAYARVHERSREELIGTSFLDLIQEPERSAIAEFVRNHDFNEGGYYENRYISPSGREYWIQWTETAITDEHGNVLEVQSVGREVTAIKQYEQALRQSEARYRAIVEDQNELICRWVPDTTLTFVNEAYCRYHEKTREELIGKRVLDLLRSPEKERVEAHVATLDPSRPFSMHTQLYISPSGKTYWMEWTDRPIFDGQGQLVEWQTVGRDITEIKNSQDALRASQQQYETLVNTIDGVVWETDPFTFQTFFISKQVEQLLGFSAQRFLDEPLFWQSRIHPEDYRRATHYAQAQISAGRSYVLEYRMITKDESVLWVRDNVSVILAEGQPVRLRGITVNVTASKLAEMAEREQRQLADALRNTAAFISATLDLDEVLDRVLDQIMRIIPADAQDIMLIEDGLARIVRSRGYEARGLGQHIYNVRLPIDTTDNLHQMVTTGKPIVIPDVTEYPHWVNLDVNSWIRCYVGAPIRLEGETIGFLNVISAAPNRFEYKHAQQLAAFADQIAIAIRNARLYERVRSAAERLEQEVRARTAELHVAHERLQAILDGTGEGIFYTEGEHIQFVNAAMSALTGYQPEELIGQPVSLLNPDGTAENARFGTLLRRLREISLVRDDLRLRRKDGSTFDAGLTVSLLQTGDDGLLRAVTMVRDISKEKALQIQKSHFVAYASHELRTPITNLKTRLYLLRRSPQRLEEHLAILEEVTERMQRLVEDLLDISRFERGMIPLQRREINISDLIRHIIDVQRPEAERKDQIISLDVPAQPLNLSGDPERLTQVITNLLNNAINYTPRGGSIHVQVEETPDRRVASIRVRDTGVGISPDNLPHIFQPFFRVVSEVEGTGLGLSIAKEITETHGGTIEVKSEMGKGSTFTVYLPLEEPQPSPG